jgi:hypothetical protein
MPTSLPLRKALLHFDPDLDRLGKDKRLRDGLSAVALRGGCLWLANDESLSIERLCLQSEAADGPVYGDHRQFPLADVLDLPVPPVPGAKDFEEADIEGLDVAGGYLWLVGSHGRKRGRVKDKGSDAENIARLARIGEDGNRCLLARIPLDDTADPPELARSVRERDGERGAARLRGDDRGNQLTRALRDDEHLGPFLAIPGKDNGFDVEGLAVRGERVFLGLRGPVLRGYAVILELRPEPDGPGWLALKPVDGDAPFRKHFLDLEGLGVRDLCTDGDDLLILAGPTQELDGPARVFRWPGGAEPKGSSLVRRNGLKLLAEIPSGERTDKAEGLALSDTAGGPGLLMVYDTPAPERYGDPASVAADLFGLVSRSG